MWISRTFLILLLLIILSIFGCTPKTQMNPTPIPYPSVTPTTLPDRLETINGSFRNQISSLEKYMPRADSEAYVVPSTQEQTDFSKLVSMIYANDTSRVAGLLSRNNYRLSYYVDQGDAYAVSYLLREQKPIQKGWGLYAFRMNSKSNIIIEAPHPLYDKRTPSVALDLYRALNARALLIAGAHRNANSDGSADAAHATESIFESVHETLTNEIQRSSGHVIVLQIHGFHSTKHVGYPQVVFGFGKETDPAELSLGQDLEKTFNQQSIKVGVCTGNDWKDLCGTKNLQASSMNGGMFIHIELDEELRKHDAAIVAALVQVFGE